MKSRAIAMMIAMIKIVYQHLVTAECERINPKMRP